VLDLIESLPADVDVSTNDLLAKALVASWEANAKEKDEKLTSRLSKLRG